MDCNIIIITVYYSSKEYNFKKKIPIKDNREQNGKRRIENKNKRQETIKNYNRR